MRPRAFTTQQKLSSRLAKWRAYLQEFIKFIRYKAGKENQVADSLRCCKHLSTSMSIIVPRFEEIWHEYPKDQDFGRIYTDLLNGKEVQHPHYNIHDDYLFQGTQLINQLPSFVSMSCKNYTLLGVADTRAVTRPLILSMVGIFSLA